MFSSPADAIYWPSGENRIYKILDLWPFRKALSLQIILSHDVFYKSAELRLHEFISTLLNFELLKLQLKKLKPDIFVFYNYIYLKF